MTFLKKYFFLIICTIVIFFVGCSGVGSGNLQTLMEAPPIIPQRPQVAESSDIANTPETTAPTTSSDRPGTGHIDIDLTRLSVTMVSAQVFQMITVPEEYLGQTVRVRGSHFEFFWEEGDMQLHYVVLNLEEGCCGQGIEFILPDDIASSIGYPPQHAIIEITGVFSSYEKAGHVFYYLAVNEMRIE